jgi:GNAT superfamily N-acetyltransferase
VTVEAEIRDLGREDLDALLALYRHLHEKDDALPERPEVERIWSEILRDPAQMYLGAFIGQALVAACNACVVPNLTRGARPYAVIENVVTHASHRRKGIGAKVVRALVDRCWARSCYKIMLMSGASRAQVHGFYEAIGFDKNAKQAFVLKAP